MRGGKRPGAGRKPGKPPPVERAKTKISRTRILKMLQGDRDPLERLIELAFDPETPIELQVSAAAAATPYLHPKLQAIVISQVPQDAAANHAQLLERVMQRLERLAPAAPVLEGSVVEQSPATSDLTLPIRDKAK